MTCYNPMRAWRTDSGITFKPGLPKNEIRIGCGQCIGCRIERTRVWATRIWHESLMHTRNCFITLTYDKENINDAYSLVPEDFTKFIKRLRKTAGAGLRYFGAGEYGELQHRPHWHTVLFGFDFEDREYWRGRGKNKIYRSGTLESLWKHGYSSIGQLTWESAQYVASYVVKKITGPCAEEYYGERVPELCRMSRRPGIGKTFFDRYKEDMYNHDECVIRGNVFGKPPEYYDRQFEKENPEEMKLLKEKRREEAENNLDNSRKRLKVKEECAESKLKKFRRSYENGNEEILFGLRQKSGNPFDRTRGD